MEAAVDAALACRVSFDEEIVVAARTRLAFLAETDRARSVLEKSMANDADDAAALGDSAARAVANGLDPEEPLLRRARSRLEELHLEHSTRSLNGRLERESSRRSTT